MKLFSIIKHILLPKNKIKRRKLTLLNEVNGVDNTYESKSIGINMYAINKRGTNEY